jgi:Flp pilus assembly protein TadG
MNSLMKWLSRFRKNRRGNAMVEFALGSGILMAAFTGTFQYGYIFYRYNTLENAVHTGARWAALGAYDSATTTPSSAYATKVKNLVVYGATTGGTNPVLPGLTTDNVTFTVNFTNGVPSVMEVKIVNYTISAVFGTMNCNNKPIVRYQYQGIWAPAQ